MTKLSNQQEQMMNYLETDVHLGLRHIFIRNEIDTNLAVMVIKAFDELEALDSKQPITINIISEGGSWTDALAIYDRIARSPCRTVAIGTGLVASAATAVLQAADERLITVNTSLLIHDGLEAYEGDPKSFEEWGRAAKAGRRLLYEIYASRSKKSVAYWERKCAHDTILTAEKVIEEGLADRIIIPAKKKDLNGTK